MLYKQVIDVVCGVRVSYEKVRLPGVKCAFFTSL